MTEEELKIGYFNQLISEYIEAKRAGETDSIGVWAALHTDLDGDEELFGDFLIYANKKQIQ